MTVNVGKLVAIGLGSNEGDRAFYLNQALARIDRIPDLRVLATSRVYESAGWGRDDLAPFLNASLVARWHGSDPIALLNALRAIEDLLGRQRTVKWGSRTLDLDLLAVEDATSNDSSLTLPHPWIAKRPFVYLPLRDLLDSFPALSELITPHPDGLVIERDTTPVEPAEEFAAWGITVPDPAENARVASHSEDETSAIGRRLAHLLLPGDILAFDAPMGSGKSVFCRGIARGLGVTGRVPSPTYTLCCRYDGVRIPFEHWDLYRLGSEDELYSAGFQSDDAPSTIRAVEWAEKFPRAVAPTLDVVLRASDTDSDSREVIFSSPHGRLGFPILALCERVGRLLP